jgi:prepilin-type processing-associated H-X9-DG protein
MFCPHCRAATAESVLQCGNCGGDLSVTVTRPDGQSFGPYSVQSVQRYLAEQRIPPNSHARLGPWPSVPVQQLLASLGATASPPGPSAPPAAPPVSYPGRPTRRKGLSTGAIVGIIAAVMLLPVIVLAAVLLPAISRGRGKARQASCMSNVKQMGLGLLMYCSDYDEVFPAVDGWQSRISPYIKNDSIFQCPESGLGSASYEYNPVMDSRAMMTIERPFASGMVWDSGFPSGTGPHSGGWDVGFCDGHARWIEKASLGECQTSF